MIFISAGHNIGSQKTKEDPGAVNSQKIKENLIAIEFRDLVCKELDKKGLKYIKDVNDEKLSDYLKRIKTGSGSVVLEFHCDSSSNEQASGTTGIIGDDSDRLDFLFSKEINDCFSSTLEIRNRGVIKESQSHRGKLGLMREQGIVSLQEMFFLSNFSDLKSYNTKKYILAPKVADIIEKYENILK